MKKIIYTILTILLGLFLWTQCVSVRVITGEDNGYEGSDKTQHNTGIDSTINEKDTTNRK